MPDYRPDYRVPIPGTGHYPRRLPGARPARLIMLVLILVAAGLVIWDATRSTATPAPVATPAPSVVVDGFTAAAGPGPVLGFDGDRLTFQVLVEGGLGVAPDGFAAAVDTILGDPRSWVGGGTVRFQRVAADGAADFTIYLASPATSAQLCAADGLDTEEFTSCRLFDNRVVINSDRWLTAIPDYGAPVAVYQAYAINHEVGHQLGHGHEACPGDGRPAPVMQQQTYGLQGCVANGWPYVDGVLYTGPPVA